MDVAPVLAPVPDQLIDEGSTLRLQLVVVNTNDVLAPLSFALFQGSPAGAAIDSATGVFTWTPSESQGPGVHPITFTVVDSGSPPLNDSKTFVVNVNEVNSAAILPAQAACTVDELTTLMVTNTATDSDIPANALAYTLVDPPPGATININGVVTWTPSETQGQSTNLITTVVIDSGVPPLSATNNFRVVVNEVNSAPVLPLQPNLTMNELTALALTNTATDSDLPANILTYQLLNPPAGALIDTRGVITWIPTEIQGPSTNLFSTVVTDNGTPALSATNSFAVTVIEVNSPPVLSPLPDLRVEAGGTLSFLLTASDRDYPTNTLSFGFSASPPPGASLDPQTGLLSWVLMPTQSTGTNLLIIGVTDNGVPPLSDYRTYTVIVSASTPELRIVGTSAPMNGQFSFAWQAEPGQKYRVQFKSNLDPAISWLDLPEVITTTGATAGFTDQTATNNGRRFYRVRTE